MAFPRTKCLSPLLLLPFFALLHANLSSAADTISANSSLSGNQNITSSGGNFVLGFFKPGNSSNRYYVGIWYGKVSLLTSVWVANREIPITDPATAELKISADGNLVLLNQSKAIIWSTNVTASSNSTVAVISDSGNLQLRDESNVSRVYWQSFDFPTDTWLPGGKIGLNKLTNENQRLTNWKNSDNPAPGIFSLEIDPKGTSQYFVIWNMTKSYWSSGTWNGQIFSGVPEMTANYIYDFEYVSNASENYFTYSVKDKNVISRFVMDVSGQIKQYTWLDNMQQWILFWSQPRQQCQVYSYCGSFGSCNEISQPYCNCVQGFSAKSQSDWDLGDQSAGCTRNTPLQCGRSSNSSNSEKDKFLTMSSMKPPVNPNTLAGVGSSEACELACLNNCSCTAYSYSSGGCSVWYEDLLDLQDQYNGSNASTLRLRLAASELQSSDSSKGKVTWIIVASVAAAIACVAIIWLVIWRRRSRRMIQETKAVGGALVPFRYSDLQHATKNFSDKLGSGGFGSVFKGSLPDSTVFAVKKLEGVRQGEKQFRSEVSTIGTIQHVNLVRLLGFCSEGTRKLLVYEFMPKGSLDTQLFHSPSTALDWKTRYQIAIGTARGLAYLHEQCRDCIIHCDIKPENILLDDSFVPKVADFGLAKLMGRDFSRVLTTMRGTRGYLAPEWITGVAITAKADVYSYGMTLMEIVSGRRNLEQTEEGGTGFFPTLVASKLIEGDVESLLDQRLGGEANMEELERACKVACWCIQDDESSRPTMGHVVQVLEGFLEVNMPPIPRSLRVISETSENINFFYNFSSNPSSQTRSATSSSSNTKSSTSNSSGA
ncbi:G-type lectin S-receptor-like serine/threonine-protein kinase [Canna indica]|uniref:Receptor-like serine/threonine-protein kinase n=1 Tax=Canna indica TaxID=4628 RepID=A0AAQ3L2Y4_9LILI|nr:G-type lectin S-receptor-like serine/threonine-protein kinase [Canna indica]